MNKARLTKENELFAGTRGLSANCAGLGFLPAFLDRESGDTRLSVSADGEPMPFHVLDGLPEDWVLAREGRRVLAVKESIISGFLRGDQFYTREEAAAAA